MHDAVLFVSHRSRQCGVHEFGLEIAEQLRSSKKFHFNYVECDSLRELATRVEVNVPAAIIFNHHPVTMPWGHAAALALAHIPTVGIVHDVTSEIAENWNSPFFSRLITHDPDLKTSNARFHGAPRPLPQYRSTSVPPTAGPIRIGSFGFAAPDKGFQEIVTAAQDSFDYCVIRLHVPFSAYGDADGARARELVEHCRASIRRPGITLEAIHDFFSKEQLIESLASNHLNALFYESDRGAGGISSAADLALASGRPMALKRGKMFRNFAAASPSIFIDDLSLPEILANGNAPLRPFLENWTQDALVNTYERVVTNAITAFHSTPGRCETNYRMVESLIYDYASQTRSLESRMISMYEATVFLRAQVEHLESKLAEKKGQDKESATETTIGSMIIPMRGPGLASKDVIRNRARLRRLRLKLQHKAVHVPRFNTLLDNVARAHYGPAIAGLFRAAPETMKRKIIEANVQQAFMVSAVEALYKKRSVGRILCVGAFEDTAYVTLEALGYEIDGIDPHLNQDLSAFKLSNPSSVGSYSIVFSTSVIEHVHDDERFVRDLVDMTAHGGAIVFTCDFRDDWTPDQQKPSSNSRIYTMRDMERLRSAMDGVEFVDDPDWLAHEPNFFISEFGVTMCYGFATMAVKKL